MKYFFRNTGTSDGGTSPARDSPGASVSPSPMKDQFCNEDSSKINLQWINQSMNQLINRVYLKRLIRC